MAQTKFAGVKSHEQLDAMIANKTNNTTQLQNSQLSSQTPMVMTEQLDETEARENWTPDEDQLAKLYQVDQLINRKYKKPTLTGSQSQIKTYQQIPFRQIVEMAMLFKVSSETEFFRRLQMTESGRLFDKQIENCLQTLQTTLEMSSEAFQSAINHLTQESKDTVLSSRRTN